MAIKRTKHTVLARVTSHGSGGRATIVIGHSALTNPSKFKDVALTSTIFKSFDVDEYIKIRITLSGKRRLIGAHESVMTNASKYVEKDIDRLTPMDIIGYFKDANNSILEIENRRYKLVYNIEDDGEPEVVEPKPEIVEPKPKVVVPELKDDSIYISNEDLKVFTVVKSLSAKATQKVLMIGPSGYGKSTVPEHMADLWGMEFLRWDCATVRDPEEFFGFRAAENGGTLDEDGNPIFLRSKLTELIERGNAVILLDELNRVAPYIANILFPLLDHAGQTSVANHDIVVGPNVIFVATINVGYQFTGTFQLDTALSNRFGIKVVVGALPKTEEGKLLMKRTGVDKPTAMRIVKIFTSLRKMNDADELSIDASTRVSLQVADLISAGLDIELAMTYVVTNMVEPDARKPIIDAIRMS